MGRPARGLRASLAGVGTALGLAVLVSAPSVLASVPASAVSSDLVRSTAPRCRFIPAPTVNKVLGTSVREPGVVVRGTVTVCHYPQGSNPYAVIVRVQGGTTAREFIDDRKTFDQHHEPTATIQGLGDAGFYATVGLPPQETYVVVVVKHGVELLITGPGSLTRLETLVHRVLPSL